MTQSRIDIALASFSGGLVVGAMSDGNISLEEVVSLSSVAVGFPLLKNIIYRVGLNNNILRNERIISNLYNMDVIPSTRDLSDAREQYEYAKHLNTELKENHNFPASVAKDTPVSGIAAMAGYFVGQYFFK